MNKICTTVEQSKKLIKLGIDVSTADMHYQWYSETESALHVGKGSKKLNADCPAWSLSALLGLIPSVISLSNHEGKYNVRYANEFIIDQKLHDSYIDACYEVVVWLKENGKI